MIMKKTEQIDKNTSKENIYRAIMLIIPFAFYIFFWLFDGVVWCVDSDSYVIMHDCREPLYPTFLAVLRGIFGVTDAENAWNNTYMSVAVLLQSLLAGAATFSLAHYLYTRLKLNKIVGIIIMFIPLFTSLLNRFVASRGSMYSNSILTEGIAISLYLLFIRYCIAYILDKDRRSYIICIVISILGILTRKQMYIMLILLIGSVIYVQASSATKAVLGVFLTSVIILAMLNVVDNVYNKVAHGSFHTHTEDNRFLSTMAFYTAKGEYAEYIPEEYRDVFLEIYDICDNNEWTYTYAPDNWYDATSHFGDNYDHIQLDTMELILTHHVDDWDMGDMTYTEKLDIVRDEYNKALIPHEIGALGHVVFNNILEGFVNTIAQKRKILCIYSVMAYLAYIILLVLMRKKSVPDNRDASVISIFILTALILNVLIVSALIFPQTRYTIYNMPLFYISMIIMASELLRSIRKD